MFSSCRKTFVDSGNKTELHKKTTRKSKFLVSNRIRVYADITNVAYFILEVEIHHKTCGVAGGKRNGIGRNQDFRGSKV